MQLQVLLSAMHLDDNSIVEKLNITGDVLVINQCDTESDQTHVEKDRTIRVISTTDRGLSISRNMAIDNSDAEICILCDNDVVYRDGYKEAIKGAFEAHKDADICVFFIKRPERNLPIKKSEGKLGYLGAMKIFSPEIAFRRKALGGLRFNESFGAGAEYGMGEENIFLWEAIKKGLNVYYIPMEIAHTMPNESTWFKGYDDRFFINRGAGYYAMAKSFWWVLALQFAVRKIGLYKNDNSFINAMKCMSKGMNDYRQKIKAQV